MFSQFFINRPIFAGVIAIIITLAGLIASQVLPVAQYPEIAPPTVVITANYPGASAETLALTVAAPIEEPVTAAEPEPVGTATAGDGLSKSQAKREKRRQRRRTRPHGRAR